MCAGIIVCSRIVPSLYSLVAFAVGTASLKTAQVDSHLRSLIERPNWVSSAVAAKGFPVWAAVLLLLLLTSAIGGGVFVFMKKRQVSVL